MQGSGHRVAITGLGVVAPCGIGKANYWNGLLGPGLTSRKYVEIEDWDPLPYFDNPKDARRSDRCEQFALAAAGEAIAQSGELPYDRARIGTIFGTGIGGLRTGIFNFADVSIMLGLGLMLPAVFRKQSSI